MERQAVGGIIWVTSAFVTAGIAVSGFAGAVGLIDGELTFGPAVNARLPFGSLVLAGLALLTFVAVPMTVAAVAAVRNTRASADLVFASGLLLVIWIAVELAFIQVYSWFHPTYLFAAAVVLGLGWLMNRSSFGRAGTHGERSASLRANVSR